MKYPVFIPEVSTFAGRLNYGHVSAVSFGRYAYLITCYHLFGVIGGLRYNIAPKNIAREIISYKFHDAETDEVVISGSEVEIIKEARSMVPGSSEINLHEDLTAFPIPDTYTGMILERAMDPPGLHEEVFALLHNQHNMHHNAVSKFPMGVIEQTESYMVGQFGKKNDDPGLSGAPIVNAQDQVIGMLVGGARDPRGGKQFGLILPIQKISQILRKASLL